MPTISVAFDTRRFRDGLDDLGRKQLPFATALAINETARLAQRALTRALPEIFSKKGAPTPFTRRAIGVQGARKTNLRATVFVKRIQASYLAIEETGGTRRRSVGAPILTPVDFTALNAYGNIPRGTLRRLRGDPKRYFLGEIRGVYGLWQRTGKPGPRKGSPRGLKLLIAFRSRAVYRPRFGFHERISATVASHFPAALSAGLAKAIATAVAR